MSKRLILILALAFVIGITYAAYAEVQNVKVGGDLLIRGVSRDNFNLTLTRGAKNDDQGTYFTSHVRVKIDADLTDNVSTTLRLINERNWDVETNTSSDIDLDLAYVTLKEFLYSPLTLTAGRQELKFGNALIIGDPDTNNAVASGVTDVPADLTLRKGFDAIRANLNYDPLIVDLILAKIDENTTTNNDDIDLYGIYASYALDKNTSIEPYFIYKKSSGTSAGEADKTDKILVPGVLISAKPIDKLKTSLEAAWQFGTRRTTTAETTRRAWATQAMADYDIGGKYSPSVGLCYTFLSGNKLTYYDRKYRAWDPMFEDQTLNSIPNALFDHTNMQVTNIKGSLKPIEDVTLLANYGYYRLAKKASTIRNVSSAATLNLHGKKELGHALDLTALYDYTEDVQLGLTFGLFEPGNAFNDEVKEAVQLIGSMKVIF